MCVARCLRMVDKDDLSGGMDQMYYEMVESEHGGIDMPCSKPAVYEWTDEPYLDVDALGSSLDEHDFSLMDPSYDTKDNGEFYCYADVYTDHYKKVHIRVWANQLCIYPQEEAPDTYEFSRIVRSIVNAFGADVEHSPDEE